MNTTDFWMGDSRIFTSELIETRFLPLQLFERDKNEEFDHFKTMLF